MTKISINNLARAIYESTKNREGDILDELIKNSAILIKEKHLLGKTDQILKALEKIIDNEEGRVKAKVSTKSKIPEKLKDKIGEFIKDRYKAKETILTYNEDSSLLGGIKIEIGDEIINMTLKNKIDQLQDYLIKN
jgi:F-type H+-transporting ATPase subunit delta